MKPKKYHFIKRHVVNKILKGREICCVYFLIKHGVIVYIGKTHNLERRICGHKSLLYSGRWFDHFRFIECEFDKLDRYERRWIRKFMPEENLHKYLRAVGRMAMYG